MMNIIASSRLRKTLKSNVFFGGVGSVITDESILNSNLFNIVVTDIEDFKINQFKDVICFINKNWGLTAGNFADKANLRFIIDLDGNFKEGIGNDNLRGPTALEFIFGENIGQNFSIASNAFQNNGIMYFPSARTFDNRDRSVGGGGIIFFDSFIENDTGITLDKLRASTHELVFIQNYNKPSPITNFTVTKVGATYAKISLTFPSHTNIMRFVEVWRLGSFLTISENENEIIITGLNPSSNNQIEIFVADQYYNRSLGYKQSILTKTTDITITEVNTGGTYAEFSINNTTPFTIVETQVYVDGVLNTISSQYAVNLNELTSYNIDIIAKTSEGIDLISNTINVTTTTTPAVFQNAVVYYKLDETSGDAIDVVNGYNGTLFGGVTQGVAGKIGTAYSFDGINAGVDLKNLIDFQITQGTLSAWVKSSNFGTGYRRVIAKSEAYGLLILDNVLITFDFSGSGDTRIKTTNINIADNEWHHVAMTFSSGVNNGTKVYLDGIEVLSTSITLLNQNFPLVIGSNYNSIQTINGLIDEASIYSAILTPAQIGDLYNNGIGTTI